MKTTIRISLLIVYIVVFPYMAEGQVVQKNKKSGEVFIDCGSLPWAVDYPLNTIGNTTTSNLTRCRVYKRLQIATDDCRSDGTKRTSSNTGKDIMYWNEAVGLDQQFNSKSAEGELQGQIKTGCALYWEKNESEKGSWRVPTVRELQLIWVLLKNGSETSGQFAGPLSKVLDASKFVVLGRGYWSSSEISTGSVAYSVNFVKGYVDNGYKNPTLCYIRCVREVK